MFEPSSLKDYSTIIAALIGALFGGLAAIITGQFNLKGKKADVTANMYTRIDERIAKVEASEEKCQDELYELRNEMASVYMINDLILQQFPDCDVDEKLTEIRKRIAERRTKYASGEGRNN